MVSVVLSPCSAKVSATLKSPWIALFAPAVRVDQALGFDHFDKDNLVVVVSASGVCMTNRQTPPGRTYIS